ncbi:tyrosine-type recombinase/integrase [Aeromonas enteropelogenes]|uniref:tyrosine-type recombinase/integrase n=1 Tax=Aeromonas enteropelogenes TaxID=29489 RepID=UPI0038D1C252
MASKKQAEITFKALMREGEQGARFDNRSVCDNLALCWPANYKRPFWRLRYRFGGKQRKMLIGHVDNMALKQAMDEAKRLMAMVTLGTDVAGEKQERKRESIARHAAIANRLTVASLADEFLSRQVEGRRKDAHVIRQRFEKDIIANLGKLGPEDVKPRHIDALLQSILDRGSPTMANNILGWIKRLFDYAIKRHIVESNPASAFTVADAGGKVRRREFYLTREKLAEVLVAIPLCRSFSRSCELAFYLLLLLGGRKMELLSATWGEFDLDKQIWVLTAERTKTEKEITIPLPTLAVTWLKEAKYLGCGSDYVFPAISQQSKPHMAQNTLNRAIEMLRQQVEGIEKLNVHALRHTARTHLAELGVQQEVAEVCLNHSLKSQGMPATYNHYQFFEERKAALELWATVIKSLLPTP